MLQPNLGSVPVGTSFKGMEESRVEGKAWCHEIPEEAISCSRNPRTEGVVERSWGLGPCSRVRVPEDRQKTISEGADWEDTSKYWGCQGHEMTTKDSSSGEWSLWRIAEFQAFWDFDPFGAGLCM